MSLFIGSDQLVSVKTTGYNNFSRISTKIEASLRKPAFAFPVRFKLKWSLSPNSFPPQVATQLRQKKIEASISSPTSLNSNADELEFLLGLLSPEISQKLRETCSDRNSQLSMDRLVEIILDLGRRPLARFPSGDIIISEETVTNHDLEFAVSKLGEFGGDNRAGIDRTLHRVSAIRNRMGRVVGLTCRVGRALSGSADMVKDLVQEAASILLMGPPGVGKTTAIRDISRTLADTYHKRVVIVDTSNEIGGDGDIPHPGIGRARRMQVAQVEMQHQVMIEAVENHMPECIVIDEVGTELEAMAACTIAQRGVQLVATAHGMTVENLIKNPSLQVLVGGIQSVTLGDEEARRRGVQKSVLERKGPPVFSCAVEMISRTEWRVHRNLAATVDSLLAGRSPRYEIREVGEDGQVLLSRQSEIFSTGAVYGGGSADASSSSRQEDLPASDTDSDGDSDDSWRERPGGALLVFTLEVDVGLLREAIGSAELEAAVEVTTDLGSADAVLALKSKLKANSWVRGMAKFRHLPIFAVKANTEAQMRRALRAMLEVCPGSSSSSSSSAEERQSSPARAPGQKSSWHDEEEGVQEALHAVSEIVLARAHPVELQPRSTLVIEAQSLAVQKYNLATEVVGTTPNCRLRILPAGYGLPQSTDGGQDAWGPMDTASSPGSSVQRLPILDE